MAAVVLAVLAACGGRRPAPPAHPTALSSIGVGECATSEVAGAVSARPVLVHADRDLGGGPEPERVVADKAMCDEVGNCHWNVFVPSAAPQGCLRYAGTLSASVLEPLDASGSSGMRDVRAYWTLASGRMLVQQYRFSRGGYRVVDALLCKTAADDRLECAEESARQ